jgi:hypothetical protein
VDVHHVFGVAMGVSGRVGRYLVHCTSKASEKDLGLVRRQPARVVDRGVDQTVRQLDEVV